MITIFHIFYNQHTILNKHFTAWRKHPKNAFKYIIIDDCSPQEIYEKCEIDNFTVFRINRDIPWNIAGARNLGFHVSSTDWVLGADIDHVVTSDAAEKILSLDLSNPDVAYTFKRVSEKDGYVGCPAIINILMNKMRFFEMGGYDEDFSGNYGREETFFWHCLQRHSIKIVQCDHIHLNWHPRYAATKGLKRDKTINSKIFTDKMDALNRGTYGNGPILRFEWKKLSS
jgi:predicted glycosyltransferase involved in capsule biosynthesis